MGKGPRDSYSNLRKKHSGKIQCLGCSKPFKSPHVINNRFCSDCRSRHNWRGSRATDALLPKTNDGAWKDYRTPDQKIYKQPPKRISGKRRQKNSNRDTLASHRETVEEHEERMIRNLLVGADLPEGV